MIDIWRKQAEKSVTVRPCLGLGGRAAGRPPEAKNRNPEAKAGGTCFCLPPGEPTWNSLRGTPSRPRLQLPPRTGTYGTATTAHRGAPRPQRRLRPAVDRRPLLGPGPNWSQAGASGPDAALLGYRPSLQPRHGDDDRWCSDQQPATSIGRSGRYRIQVSGAPSSGEWLRPIRWPEPSLRIRCGPAGLRPPFAGLGGVATRREAAQAWTSDQSRAPIGRAGRRARRSGRPGARPGRIEENVRRAESGVEWVVGRAPSTTDQTAMTE